MVFEPIISVMCFQWSLCVLKVTLLTKLPHHFTSNVFLLSFSRYHESWWRCQQQEEDEQQGSCQAKGLYQPGRESQDKATEGWGQHRQVRGHREAITRHRQVCQAEPKLPAKGQVSSWPASLCSRSARQALDRKSSHHPSREEPAWVHHPDVIKGRAAQEQSFTEVGPVPTS